MKCYKQERKIGARAWLCLDYSGKNYAHHRRTSNLRGSFTANYGLQMVGGLLITLPTLILFVLLGRYLIRGYTQGSIR